MRPIQTTVRFHFGLLCVVALAAACGDSSPAAPSGGAGGGGGGGAIQAALSAISVMPAAVSGGTPAQGTITLTAGAPAGGATVSFASNNAAVAATPASVTVPAGASSAAFDITTVDVASPTAVQITGTYSGQARSATFTVNPAPLTPIFSVVSDSKGQDACAIIGAALLDCVFDATPSTGSIEEYRWTYFVGNSMASENTVNAETRPMSGCGFLGGQASTTVGGVEFIQMEVHLVLREAGTGNLGNEAVNANVRMFPNGQCGYGF